ncbi:MAG: transporter [Bacteroidia bacterium]|nr:transporter [Bacteroidia bacterium]MBP7715167.1 transporter [Bacteroidia bacterium]HOZ89628.1 transporter [Bacteroidia bacterium]HQW17984.1 transporter [Bacteroidia bacterium]HQW49304.1 transporter [Bacteroidia bacterium]
MKFTFQLFLLLLFTATHLRAQEENINTDRPDQSDGVYTLTKKHFQIEEGVTIGKNLFVNNLMLRYGLTNSTEIRLLSDVGKIDESNGFLPLTISVKQKIIKQKNLIPAITAVGYMSYEKIASKDFQTNNISYELKLAFENEVNENFTVSYNAGLTDEFKTFNYTLNLGYSPIEKLSLFAEYFGSVNSSVQHNADAGILILLYPKLQVDIACGHSIADSDNRFYTTFGISYKF